VRETKEAAACTARRGVVVVCVCSRSSLPAIHSISPFPCYSQVCCRLLSCILLLDTTLHDLFHSRQHQRLTLSHARFHPPLLFDFPAYLTIPAAAQNGTVSPRASPPLSTTSPTLPTVHEDLRLPALSSQSGNTTTPTATTLQHETPRRAPLNSER
jgi:hypothetical protein